MDYSSLRAEAKKRLTGKWGQVILVMLLVGLVSGLINYIPSLTKTTVYVSYYFYSMPITQDNIVSVTLSLVALVASLMLTFGLVHAYWNVYKGENVGAADGLKYAFANLKKSLFILLNVAKKVLIPLIMFAAGQYLSVIFISNVVMGVIGTIVSLAGLIWLFIAGLHYALVYVIAADEPNLSEEEVVNRSKELMTNKRGKFFVLQLSFFGWCLLGVLSLGIGMLWVAPWMQFAVFAFYDNCKGASSAPVAEVTPVTEEKAE